VVTLARIFGEVRGFMLLILLSIEEVTIYLLINCRFSRINIGGVGVRVQGTRNRDQGAGNRNGRGFGCGSCFDCAPWEGYYLQAAAAGPTGLGLGRDDRMSEFGMILTMLKIVLF
jgi:hypothetical protein